jgi:hypothetical protein
VKTQHKRSRISATLLSTVAFFIMSFSVSAQSMLLRAPSFEGKTVRALNDSDPRVPWAVQAARVPRIRLNRRGVGREAIQLSEPFAVTTSSYYWYSHATILSARRPRIRHVYLVSPQPPARDSVGTWWCCLYLGVAY